MQIGFVLRSSDSSASLLQMTFSVSTGSRFDMTRSTPHASLPRPVFLQLLGTLLSG